MAKKRRWPTAKEVAEKWKRGIIDDTEAAVPPYDLEPWEILGEPAPKEQAAGDRDVTRGSRRKERA